MPEYCRKCSACSHTFTLYRKMSEPHDDPCPVCQGATDADFAAQGACLPPTRPLHGTAKYSMEYRFPEREVPELKRLYGSDLEGCIKPNGDTEFDTVDQFKRFVRKDRAIREDFKRKREAKSERESKTRAKRGEPAKSSQMMTA